ncbi:LLM class flavin-dependent oxidoreductase [Pseudonocardia adelaidensis]|uniref:LLM class flavin-dependent oxidoreductase n=1 Tax=Pseudonocardia adelaidensis TaxID=648754 RepID=A0ABP9NMY2_9PSEU
MKIGIGLPNQVRNLDPTVIPRWAARAEEAGFSTLGTVGRYAYPGVSDTVALASAAGATSRIGLLSHVLLAPTWPPYLLAKELAGIDGVSGGRLTLGIGIGGRDDDFVVDGLSIRGRGKRLDSDLQTYRSVWKGEPVGGGPNPAVPDGTRQVPLLFGAMSDAAFKRAAREGDGFIGASMPPGMVAQSFDVARKAWAEADRTEAPRLVAIAYFAIGDVDKGRANVWDYYSASGTEVADLVAGNLSGGVEAIRNTVKAFEDIGADELVLGPGIADPDEISRLADAVL